MPTALVAPIPDTHALAPSHRSPKLSADDLLFIDAYLRHERNGGAAYRAVHPRANKNTSYKQACLLLQQPKIAQEIAKRVRHEAGITKEMVESTLLQALAWANEKHDHLATASIAMDCAKLAGFLVDKRQDVTPAPSLTPEQLADELRKRGFVSVPTN